MTKVKEYLDGKDCAPGEPQRPVGVSPIARCRRRPPPLATVREPGTTRHDRLAAAARAGATCMGGFEDMATTATATSATRSVDELVINTIRFLAVDRVEKANSGHPGAPMGLAPLAYQLWTRHLRFNPRDPAWPNRDRFVLSAGHASALLYALLHLSGSALPMSELQRFRQYGSITPGHPEHGHTPGVETTTGPLGQGLG